MKKFVRILTAMCLALVLTFAFTACGDKPENKPGPDGKITLAFAKPSVEVTYKDEMELKVQVTGAKTEKVSFASSKSGTVGIKRNYTSVGVTNGEAVTILEGKKEGTATITAKCGDASATISVTVKQYGVFVDDPVISATPGDTGEFEVSIKNVEGTPAVQSDLTGVTATLTEKTGGATVTYVVTDDAAVLGETATITVSAGEYSAKVEIDVCSKGIEYGDTVDGGRLIPSNEFQTAARGLNESFQNGALVFPRYAYIEYSDGDGNKSEGWVRVTTIGCGPGNENTPGIDENVDPFVIPAGKEITSVDTGDAATTVQHKAFKEEFSIESVHFGDSMTGIGDQSFQGDWATHLDYDSYLGKLTKISFSENCKIQAIGSNAFSYQPLQTVILPDSISTIASAAFQFTAIETLKLPANWKQAPVAGLSGNGFFVSQFTGLVRLKNLYMPWQNFYAINSALSDMRKTPYNGNPGQPKPGANDEERELIEQLGVDTTFGAYNTVFEVSTLDVGYGDEVWNQGKVTIHYMGDKQLADNMLELAWNGSKVAITSGYVPFVLMEGAFGGAVSTWEVFFKYSTDPADKKPDTTDPETGAVTPGEVRWAFGNEHTDWDFGADNKGATCPYKLDGTKVQA